MEYIITAAVLAAVFIGSVLLLAPSADTRRQRRKDSLRDTGTHRAEEGKWPFYPTYAMSRNEQQLYWKLVSALPDYIVLAQVQASRILKIKKSANQQYWFNRVNRMSYDYVVCHKNSYPLAVIELDDSTHERDDRQEADRRKNKILHDAGLTLLRWRKENIPDSTTIAELIRQIDTEQQQRRQALQAARKRQAA